MTDKKPIRFRRDAISRWFIYMPSDIDRNTYIQNCFRTGTVTLVDEWNEIQHRARIGKLALQSISFPKDIDSKGSEVICNSMPYSGQLYVVDVYYKADEFVDQTEESYRFIKTINGGIAELLIDGNGKINLNVDSEEVSEVSINVTDKNKSGKFTVNVNGSATLNASKNVLINSPKISLNESDEPVLLGNKTVTLLENILKQLEKESAGPYPLLGRAVYTQIKERLDEIKSKISFVQ